MSTIILKKESREIRRQMLGNESSTSLLCPILRVLQMRHRDLDMRNATDVVREILED